MYLNLTFISTYEKYPSVNISHFSFYIFLIAIKNNWELCDIYLFFIYGKLLHSLQKLTSLHFIFYISDMNAKYIGVQSDYSGGKRAFDIIANGAISTF